MSSGHLTCGVMAALPVCPRVTLLALAGRLGVVFPTVANRSLVLASVLLRETEQLCQSYMDSVLQQLRRDTLSSLQTTVHEMVTGILTVSHCAY